jgi:NAD(P)-dependent dehydrogenase (short-subunit alcohol dehydrogenase family)
MVVVNDLGGSRDGSGAGSAMADGVVDEIRAAGGDAVASYDSVATADGAAAIVATALESYGRIDGVINNAGILRDVSFAKMSVDQWDAVVQVHLYGAYHLTRAAWPHLREHRYGRVLMATSTSGLYGNFGQSNYGAAKMGLVGLMNTLALEGARSGIQVNAMAPMAATRMTEDVAPADLLESLPAEQVAPTAVYLMTEESTDNGSVFVVGGGLVQRVALFQSEGVRFAQPPTVAELAKEWGRIADLSDAKLGDDPLR